MQGDSVLTIALVFAICKKQSSWIAALLTP